MQMLNRVHGKTKQVFWLRYTSEKVPNTRESPNLKIKNKNYVFHKFQK